MANPSGSRIGPQARAWKPRLTGRCHALWAVILRPCYPAELPVDCLLSPPSSAPSAGRDSLRAVSQRLGHSNPALTLKAYAHCLPNDDAQLAAGLTRLMA